MIIAGLLVTIKCRCSDNSAVGVPDYVIRAGRGNKNARMPSVVTYKVLGHYHRDDDIPNDIFGETCHSLVRRWFQNGNSRYIVNKS